MSSPKHVFIFILFSVTVALSSASPSLSSSIKTLSCPCQCFVGREIDSAAYQCKEPRYRHICEVTSCKKSHRVGKSCCDIIPPTPSPTPSPEIIPCPCICRRNGYHAAEKECKQPYISPKCKVLSCGHHGKYECCKDVPPTPTATPTPSVTPSPKVIPCPCVCRRNGYHAAEKECKQPYISPKCKVLSCGHHGKYECCDHKPTPSPTPTTSPKPKCPCYCTKLREAVDQCRKLPHCSWSECRTGGFSCCDKH